MVAFATRLNFHLLQSTLTLWNFFLFVQLCDAAITQSAQRRHKGSQRNLGPKNIPLKITFTCYLCGSVQKNERLTHAPYWLILLFSKVLHAVENLSVCSMWRKQFSFWYPTLFCLLQFHFCKTECGFNFCSIESAHCVIIFCFSNYFYHWISAQQIHHLSRFTIALASTIFQIPDCWIWRFAVGVSGNEIIGRWSGILSNAITFFDDSDYGYVQLYFAE